MCKHRTALKHSMHSTAHTGQHREHCVYQTDKSTVPHAPD